MRGNPVDGSQIGMALRRGDVPAAVPTENPIDLRRSSPDDCFKVHATESGTLLRPEAERGYAGQVEVNRRFRPP